MSAIDPQEHIDNAAPLDTRRLVALANAAHTCLSELVTGIDPLAYEDDYRRWMSLVGELVRARNELQKNHPPVESRWEW